MINWWIIAFWVILQLNWRCRSLVGPAFLLPLSLFFWSLIHPDLVCQVGCVSFVCALIMVDWKGDATRSLGFAKIGLRELGESSTVQSVWLRDSDRPVTMNWSYGRPSVRRALSELCMSASAANDRTVAGVHPELCTESAPCLAVCTYANGVFARTSAGTTWAHKQHDRMRCATNTMEGTYVRERDRKESEESVIPRRNWKRYDDISFVIEHVRLRRGASIKRKYSRSMLKS